MHLNDLVVNSFRLVEGQKRALKKLRIETIADLLFHFPTRYENIADIKGVATLQKGDEAIVFGTLKGLKTRKTWKSRRAIAEGWLEDGTGRIKVMWFNQPYIAKMVQEGVPVKLTGAIGGSEGKLYITNPEVEIAPDIPVDATDSLFEPGSDQAELFAVYPESKGITSKWFRHALERVLTKEMINELADPIPDAIIKRYKLPSLTTALIWLHQPQSEDDALSARKRFAFQEVFLIQLAKFKDRAESETHPSLKIKVDKKKLKEFTDRFPFEPTKAQNDAINDILTDFETPGAMSRLVEGDVGSGKTAVAAATVYAVTTTKLPGKDYGNMGVAYMCPTEILAKQHFASFVEYFSHLPLQIGLITSSGCKKFPSKTNPNEATNISKAQLLKWVANGEIPILIGTHSLIYKSVQFKNLAYVIIDEQHRFGTMQRQKLTRKDEILPHLLSMTATPIPRTLSLTIYGDLDLTVIDQMPKGRKPIITDVVKSEDRNAMYTAIREQLKEGRQVYVICPRIDEPDPEKEMAVLAKSVIEEAKRLQKEVFQEYEIDILHSKMKPAEKEAVMANFAAHNTDILVATSVVEVGVNVPNATVIIIEGAERFGLAQLHQLRGRVIRSNHQAYCYAYTDSKSKHSLERLNALKTAKNGFELAEFDLKLRGAGELYGRAQSGLTDLGMEALKNLKMVEAARKEAQKLIKTSPSLEDFPLLKEEVEKKAERLHFE